MGRAYFRKSGAVGGLGEGVAMLCEICVSRLLENLQHFLGNVHALFPVKASRSRSVRVTFSRGVTPVEFAGWAR